MHPTRDTTAFISNYLVGGRVMPGVMLLTMTAKLHPSVMALSAVLLCSLTGGAKTPERARILLACEQEFGSPVDETLNLFNLNQAFVLQVEFDGRGKLAELAVKPKYFFNETHPEWDEPRSFPLLSRAEFTDLVRRLDMLKPKGRLTRPANTTSVITNSTGYFTETYQRASLEWGEVGIRGEAGNGIRFFTVRYSGVRRRPRQ